MGSKPSRAHRSDPSRWDPPLTGKPLPINGRPVCPNSAGLSLPLVPASGPADGHCGLLSESMRSLGSGKAISCPTEWRSRRGPVMVRVSPMAESLA